MLSIEFSLTILLFCAAYVAFVSLSAMLDRRASRQAVRDLEAMIYALPKEASGRDEM